MVCVKRLSVLLMSLYRAPQLVVMYQVRDIDDTSWKFERRQSRETQKQSAECKHIRFNMILKKTDNFSILIN